MLIDFRVGNFRSFRDEQTLSLVASKRLGDEHCAHCIKVPGLNDRLLRAGVIWGANGSGKSNLFKAMRFAVNLILHGTEPKKAVPYQPFAFSEEHLKSPMVFEFRFMMWDEVYSYGFAADSRQIHEEWLLHHEGGKTTTLFERETAGEGEISMTLGAPLKGKRHPKVAALSTVGTRRNQLFLTSIRDNIAADDYGELLEPVIEWFEKHLSFIGPDDSFVHLAELIVADGQFAEFAGDFLRCSDTGVGGLSVETTELDREHMLGSLDSESLDKMLASAGEGDVIVLGGPDGTQIIVEKEKGPKFKLRRIKADHRIKGGETSELPFAEESDGTRRLLDLLPALYQLQSTCKVFVIDELDRSMHPNLSWEFLRFFLTACEGRCRQLVVTTHEDRLLDLELLRRDEIWFVQKNSDGASELRSLSAYKVRKDLKIDKGYLNGRFGGVPQIGHLLGLLPEATESAEADPDEREAVKAPVRSEIDESSVKNAPGHLARLQEKNPVERAEREARPIHQMAKEKGWTKIDELERRNTVRDAARKRSG